MELKDWILLTALAAIWGSAFMFIKISAVVFGPILLVTLRLLIAGLVFMPLLLKKKNRLLFKPYLPAILIIAVVSNALPFTLFAYASLGATSNMLGILNGTTAFLTTIIAYFWLKESVTSKQVIGLILGFVGVLILVNPSNGSTTFIASICAMFGSLCYAFNATYLQKYHSNSDKKVLIGWSMLFGGFLMIPLASFNLPNAMPDTNSILALMVGTAGLPHVIVRFFTVKKVSDARKSAGIALMLIAILYTTAPAVAAFARTNLLETISNKPYVEVPQWFKKWEDTGLIRFDDINNDGLINYVNNEKNELYVDRDIMVLANPEIANLPNWVIALVAAGGLAAALSTAAGLLLVISASVSHDLIKRVIYPEISEKGELIAARISAFFAVCVAGYFGVNPPGFVAAVVALAFGLAASSFFPAIVMGIFYKRMNKEGAIAGMLVGISLMLFYMLKFKFDFFGGGDSNDYWFGISPEGFGTIAMAANFIVSIVVMNFTSPTPDRIKEIVDNIRIPENE